MILDSRNSSVVPDWMTTEHRMGVSYFKLITKWKKKSSLNSKILNSKKKIDFHYGSGI